MEPRAALAIVAPHASAKNQEVTIVCKSGVWPKQCSWLDNTPANQSHATNSLGPQFVCFVRVQAFIQFAALHFPIAVLSLPRKQPPFAVSSTHAMPRFGMPGWCVVLIVHQIQGSALLYVGAACRSDKKRWHAVTE